MKDYPKSEYGRVEGRTPSVHQEWVTVVTFNRGLGTTEEPCRLVRAYYNRKGNLLFEDDAQPVPAKEQLDPKALLDEYRSNQNALRILLEEKTDGR